MKSRYLGVSLLLTAERYFYAGSAVEKQKPYIMKELAELYKNKRPDELEKVFDDIVKADPVAQKTNGQKAPFTRHIVRWLKSGTVRLPEDIDNIRDVVKMFNEKKQTSSSVEVKRADLSQFDSPAAIIKFIKGAEGDEDETEGGIATDPSWFSKLKEVYSSGRLKVYEVTPKDQSYVNKWPEWNATRWCVRNSLTMYGGGPFYLVRYDDKLITLMEKGSQQIKDVMDHLPSPAEQKTIAPAIRFVFSEPPPTSKEAIALSHMISAYEQHSFKDYHLLDFIHSWRSQETPVRMTNYLVRGAGSDLEKVAPVVYTNKKKNTDEVVAELNEAIDSDKQSLFMLAAFYAKDHGLWDKVSKKLKQKAMTDADLAVLYAFLVENRFESAEPLIMKEPRAASDYALYILKRRWPEAEKTIVKDPLATCAYAHVFGRDTYKKIKMKDDDFYRDEFPKMVERGEIVFDSPAEEKR